MKEKHNKNYQRIDKAIIDAYNELLKEKGTPDFSITELCDKANVNRTTFYKHYHGVYEITERLEDELIFNLFNIEYKQKIGFINFLREPKPIIEKLNKNIIDNKEFYRRVFRPERLHYIITKCVHYLVEAYKVDCPKSAKRNEILKRVRINLTDFVGSLAILYTQWLNNYLNCDVSDITTHICEVINHVYVNTKIPL